MWKKFCLKLKILLVQVLLLSMRICLSLFPPNLVFGLCSLLDGYFFPFYFSFSSSLIWIGVSLSTNPDPSSTLGFIWIRIKEIKVIITAITNWYFYACCTLLLVKKIVFWTFFSNWIRRIQEVFNIVDLNPLNCFF